MVQFGRALPQGLKPTLILWVTARLKLKPCPCYKAFPNNGPFEFFTKP